MVNSKVSEALPKQINARLLLLQQKNCLNTRKVFGLAKKYSEH